MKLKQSTMEFLFTTAIKCKHKTNYDSFVFLRFTPHMFAPLSPLPLQEPSCNQQNKNIENYVTDEDTEVSPPGWEADLQRNEEGLSISVLAELTIAGRVGVIDVAANGLGEGTSPLLTSLSWRSSFEAS